MRVSAFGELMVRITPKNYSSFLSLPNEVNFGFGGAEANFLSNLSNFGIKSFFISALPKNPIGYAALNELNKFGINTKYIRMKDKGRMGLYYCEEGVGSRATNITYDRKDSAINKLDFEDYNFKKVFEKTQHYHISGITPAISEKAMFVSLKSVRLAKDMGLKVSCDLNYRSKLWNYKLRGKPVDKEKVMSELLQYCDYVFGNEIDLQSFFKIDVSKKEYQLEKDDLVYYENLLLQISKRFPHIKIIALSIRKSENASSNYLGGVLYKRETNQFYFSPNIEGKFKMTKLEPINDRIGSGDAFSAGFIYGLTKYDNLQNVLDFALYSSVLKHTYKGDFNYAKIEEVEEMVSGNKYGRIKR
ncbi:MAG TPA: sugar kinase [Spirochaetota bacterium]|nr:sugar kinase [Spirochaetota bacterium]